MYLSSRKQLNDENPEEDFYEVQAFSHPSSFLGILCVVFWVGLREVWPKLSVVFFGIALYVALCNGSYLHHCLWYFAVLPSHPETCSNGFACGNGFVVCNAGRTGFFEAD